MLTHRERVAFGLSCAFTIRMLLIAFAIAGCGGFVEEGVGEAELYRPPRPGPHPSSHDTTAGATSSPMDSDGSSESEGGAATTSEDGSTGTTPSSDDTSESSDGSSSESGSTGEGAYEPAHCDTPKDPSCPDDAEQIVMPDDLLESCYCATPCTDDDDCGPHEWCDPFFAACTVWCDAQEDCYTLDGTMTCVTWWVDADTWTRFCAYPNEAP